VKWSMTWLKVSVDSNKSITQKNLEQEGVVRRKGKVFRHQISVSDGSDVWDVMPYSLVDICRLVRGTRHLHLYGARIEF
jgi:hypothetical protein